MHGQATNASISRTRVGLGSVQATMRIVQLPDYRKDNPYQHLLADALSEQGIETIFPIGYRRGFPFSRGLLAMKGIDVLHLHWLTPYLKGATSAVKSLYAAKLLFDCLLVKARGIRLVWTVHNLISHDTTTPRLEKHLSRLMAQLANRLIVHSEDARETVAQQFRVALEKITVIPHGSYAEAYGPPVQRLEARARLGLDPLRPVFLFFGMIRPYKGVAELLEAWRSAPDLHEHALLIIAGDARDSVLATTIHNIADKAPNVQLHMRFIGDEEIPLFFGAADWLVLPFTQSLTSGTAILAQAYGIPLVASNVEGLQTGFGECANETFEAGNRDALRNALARARKRTIASKDSPLKNRSEIDHQHNWAKIARMHGLVYGIAPATLSNAP